MYVVAFGVRRTSTSDDCIFWFLFTLVCFFLHASLTVAASHLLYRRAIDSTHVQTMNSTTSDRPIAAAAAATP